MDKWIRVFSSHLNSGVLFVSQPLRNSSVKRAAAEYKLDYTPITLKGVTDKVDFLQTVATALNFPAYFGMNWDALNDSLTDLSWKPANGYVILFTNFNSLSENMAEDVHVIKNIFKTSAEYWKQRAVPFFILISE
jgi:RNAse (barnase) inhibitor barstar